MNDMMPPMEPVLKLETCEDRPPIRVLHARVVVGAGGGPDKTILRSASHCDPSEIAMTAAYLHPPHDPGIDVVRATARRLNCPLFEVPDRGPIDRAAISQLLDLCRDLDINVWHAHDYKTDVLGLWLRRHHPMKLVTTVHGFTRETWRTRLYYHIDNLCLRRYDHVLAVSPPLMDHCRQHHVPSQRLSYVPNAIDAGEYRRSSSREQARAEAGVPVDRPVIGVISRLSPEKGVDRAIHLLASLRQKFPTVELHLIGDGPARYELADLARRLDVGDAIRWYGWRCDTRRFYEMMDLLLLPSHREGLPNVVLEAMAMGTPVAATRVGGVADLLDEGRCGVLLHPTATATWPVSIAPLLNESTEGQRLARLARQRIVERFTFARRMESVASIYRQVLGIAEPAAPDLRRAA